MSVLILLSKRVTSNGLYYSLGDQHLFSINQRQNKLIPTPEPDSGLHQPSRLCVLGLDNLKSCATPPAQPVCAVNIHIPPGFAFPALCGMSTDEFPEQLETTWLPKEREHLVLTPGQAHEGFYRCWECWQKSCVLATLRGAFPVSLRWSHHYSQVITGPVTWLLLQACPPWHPSASHRAWECAPSAGTGRAVFKCKADLLTTWKRGCNLSPPYFLHKKSLSWS